VSTRAVTVDGFAGFGVSIEFQQTGSGPGGSLGPGSVLAARNLGDGLGLDGSLNITLYEGDGIPFISHIASDNDRPVTFSVQVSPVPEPAAYAMLGGGLLALGLRRRVRGKTV
jgi:hypothetical protein